MGRLDIVFGCCNRLVLTAPGHLKLGSCSDRELFKGTNPLNSSERPGRRGKGKDTALDSAFFFLLGSLGPHRQRLCHAEKESSQGLLGGPGQKGLEKPCTLRGGRK